MRVLKEGQSLIWSKKSIFNYQFMTQPIGIGNWKQLYSPRTSKVSCGQIHSGKWHVLTVSIVITITMQFV